MNDTTIAKTQDWEKLVSIPAVSETIQYKIIRIPIQIKPNECIILPNKLTNKQIIYAYNSSKNKLNELTKYPENFATSNKYTAAVDTFHNTLYIFINPSHMITFNITTKTWTQMDIKTPTDILTHIMSQQYDVYTFNLSIITKNGLFVIMTIHGAVIYDINTKLFSNIRTGGERYDFSMIYFHNTNEIWKLGGGSDDGCYSLNSINEFVISKKEFKWARYEHELPNTFFRESFGCVVTLDEKYILLFGGRNQCDDDFNMFDDIYIMDMINNIKYISNIKCPITQMFYSCLMCDDYKTDLIVNGYIKMCLELNGLNYMQYSSNEVAMIVSLYYYVQCVHLFDRINGYQWKIGLDTIFCDMKQLK